jgi:predicted glycogen debranching enzyme
VEWFARDKVDVHGAPSLSWDATPNQVAEIRRLNTVLAVHPCMHAGSRLALIHRGEGNAIALRRTAGEGRRLLVLANLDAGRPSTVAWQDSDFPADGGLTDLLTGRPAEPRHAAHLFRCALEPGQVLCLTPDPTELPRVEAALADAPPARPPAAVRQELRAMALDAWCSLNPGEGLGDADADRLAADLAEDPGDFCRRIARGAPLVTRWSWPRDLRRVVMLPPGHFLLLQSPHPFVARLCDTSRVLRFARALRKADGSWFAILPPLPTPDQHRRLTLEFRAFQADGPGAGQGEVLLLADADNVRIALSVSPPALREGDLSAIGTNGRNALGHVRAAWGATASQYDAMLAANLDPEVPVDRHVMLTRCRAWVVNRGYSQEIGLACTDRFAAGLGGGALWRFTVPVGMGRQVTIEAAYNLVPGRNESVLEFRRLRATRREEDFPDDHPVDLIVRPDVEDRPNHGKTKAYTGPERHWPKAVTADPTGFRFAPACDRILCMHAAPGAFAVEPQWSYMVGHPEDADRGFDGSSDVFSPGYFTLSLRGGETALLHAAIGPSSRHAAPRTLLPPTVRDAGPAVPLLEALREALRAYVVRRNESRTVIAGYPWFLDWGRDTLIVLRGLVAAGMLEESRDILRQFARFESQGTLPNRIRGSDSSDRDTSDAPLWFFAACADLDRAGDGNLASMDCGGRTLREVLLSIARHYRDGTPNGIRMDPASGLIYSPSHFTWMDTNYPAGTPRQGYPIEIQALWHAALRYLAALDPGGAWVALAEQARRSVLRLYQKPGRAFLSDCLHAAPGTPAGDAAPDDALRPNQLLAVCLGLVQDPSVASRVVDACEELLVPGALRSLADRPVAVPIAVRRDGDLLNDPLHPYWGAYRGDEDTRRKPAYHNGTAWTWLLPLYAEALLCAHGEPVRRSALALLGSVSVLLEKRCLGQIPELTDGDAPHTPRGTFAQAWGVSEHLRVLCLLRRIAPVRRS